MVTVKDVRFGWLRDLPDMRDYTLKNNKAGIRPKIMDVAKLPASIDFRGQATPIEDQGELGSCTAHAVMGAIEYMEKKSTGKYVDGSRRFLYKTTRKLMGMTGDTGAYLRTTIGAAVLLGVPPEKYFPYKTGWGWDAEPSQFVYALGQPYRTAKYVRLDGSTGQGTVDNMKAVLATSTPVVFGFTCYDSLYNNDDGKITYPSSNNYVVGGHAIGAFGYDDSKTIGSVKGAFLIRNSWGTSWGEKGWGWLPYKYFTGGLADDVWEIVDQNWVDVGQFDFDAA